MPTEKSFWFYLSGRNHLIWMPCEVERNDKYIICDTPLLHGVFVSALSSLVAGELMSEALHEALEWREWSQELSH